MAQIEVERGLFAAPTFKIEDRRKIVLRVLGALLLDEDCRWIERGEWQKLTSAETANWEARQTLMKILSTF